MTYTSHWRQRARAVIQKVIKDNPDKKGKELLRVISEAYPFVERKYHPYKIWLDEVKVQTGQKVKHPYRQPLPKKVPVDPNQMELL